MNKLNLGEGLNAPCKAKGGSRKQAEAEAHFFLLLLDYSFLLVVEGSCS
jgi:hypothetical protein